MPIKIVSGQAAVENVANEPCFLMIYGPPGFGKTTDAVTAFPNAFFVQCEEGALKPILARGFAVPDHTQEVVKTYEQLAECVAYVAQSRKYSAIIIDTLTTWTGGMYRYLQAHLKTRNNWDIPVALRNMLFQLREYARSLGVHVVLIAHPKPPYHDDKGVFHKGSPLLQPSSAPDIFIPVVDTVLRIDNCNIAGKTQRVYFTGGPDWPDGVMKPADADLWWAKNREGVRWAVVPADLKAFLQMRTPPYRGL